MSYEQKKRVASREARKAVKEKREMTTTPSPAALECADKILEMLSFNPSWKKEIAALIDASNADLVEALIGAHHYKHNKHSIPCVMCKAITRHQPVSK